MLLKSSFLNNLPLKEITEKNPVIPGLIVTTITALLATFLNSRPGFNVLSTLLLSIILGIIIGNTVKISKVYEPGIKFSLKRILKLSIILLGLKLSFAEILRVGPVGLGITAITLVSTFLFTNWLGNILKINQKLVKLIASGTAICGTSAIVATNGVVDASEEEVAYSVATVTALGTVAVLVYPLLPEILNLMPSDYGLWCGISIHQTAQVFAAAGDTGYMGLELATISKLSRVLFLAPTILVLGFLSVKNNHQVEDRKTKSNFKKLPIPWFIFIFLGVVVINSLSIIPDNFKDIILNFNKFLLAISMVAMGIQTNLFKLKQTGLKPLYLATASWLFLASLSLVIIKLLQFQM